MLIIFTYDTIGRYFFHINGHDEDIFQLLLPSHIAYYIEVQKNDNKERKELNRERRQKYRGKKTKIKCCIEKYLSYRIIWVTNISMLLQYNNSCFLSYGMHWIGTRLEDR